MIRLNRTAPIAALLLGNALLLSACGAKEEAAASSPAASATAATAAASAPTSPAAASPAAKSAASEAIQAVIAEYRTYVTAETDGLVKETEAFVKAVKAGDLETAKKLYAPARMHFERIEPIAESLGDFDPWIDARENDVPLEEWRGFHKLEKALWVEGSTKGNDQTADQLLNDVHLLRVKVENVEIEPAILATGAVELLNEVSSTKVTGEEERYSHTDLYDFAANVQGAEKIYQLLRPELEKKDAALAKSIGDRFKELNDTLALYKDGDGYKLYTALNADDTKALSRKLDALAEPLSHLGIVLEG